MKSDFNRFSHHTLSHSDVKPQSTPILSYSGLTRISRWNKFANWFDLDTPIKPECDRKGKNASLKPNGDSLCAGRSMVEMLGVLAIIGVLSVGAIAGYSKAMMKYKLNKLASEYNYIIASLLEHSADLKKLKATDEYQERYYLNEIMNKLNIIPSSWKIKGNYTLIDSVGFATSPFIRNKHINFDIYFGIEDSDITQSFANDFCFEYFKSVILPSHNSISYVTLWKSNGNSIDYYGNSYCEKGRKCLSNITMTEIHDVCNSCIINKEKCVFNIQI